MEKSNVSAFRGIKQANNKPSEDLQTGLYSVEINWTLCNSGKMIRFNQGSAALPRPNVSLSEIVMPKH